MVLLLGAAEGWCLRPPHPQLAMHLPPRRPLLGLHPGQVGAGRGDPHGPVACQLCVEPAKGGAGARGRPLQEAREPLWPAACPPQLHSVRHPPRPAAKPSWAAHCHHPPRPCPGCLPLPRSVPG